jgi:hypothetical protein
MKKPDIKKSLKRVEDCVKDGYDMEAFLVMYHLNISIIHHIALGLGIKDYAVMKPKQVVAKMDGLAKASALAKGVIGGKNLKSMKGWLKKTDVYFKNLRVRKPANTRVLLHEGEKIFLLLNISSTKLSARK